MHWTIDQILAFAPDPNTSKKGQGLASSRNWAVLESNGRAIWGECKSSGASYYKTAVDLKGPAFRCSCPSRKFPCKHALGLLLLSQTDTDSLKIVNEVPEEVQTWLDKRDLKSEKPKKTDEEQAKADAAKAKRFEKRLANMKNGIDDLETWLEDIIRTGLAASVMDRDAEFSNTPTYRDDGQTDLWRNFSMRMVDAQLPGIARKIREMALLHGSGSEWPAEILDALSELHLMAQGFRRLDQLPPDLYLDVLRVVGVTTKKDSLADLPAVKDDWMVLGQFERINIDHANVRRLWMFGKNTKRYALLLDYDYNNAGFGSNYPTGRIFRGELIFYPSAYPLRAIVKQVELTPMNLTYIDGYENIENFRESYASALGKNPWLQDFPVALSNVIPQKTEEGWFLVDQEGKAIPLFETELNGWKITALSGGRYIDVFGEWTGEQIRVLGLAASGRYIAL